MLQIFITGTDTNIGKTYVAVAMLKFFAQQNLKAVGFKPIASGAFLYKGLLLNEDAVRLQHASSIQLPYNQINPFLFEAAIAPNIADRNKTLTSEALYKKYQAMLKHKVDILLVEGVGGWCTPLNINETMADFVEGADLGVIIVVGMKLGCLNHAILTVQNIAARGVKIHGWIANCLNNNMESLTDNIKTLEDMLNIPFLGSLAENEEISMGTKLAQELLAFYKGSFAR